MIDNGPGVSPEARQRLFELSVTKAAGKKGGGLGAGLALSSNLARNWGGMLRYEPREGGGSIFTVTLPVASLADTKQMNKGG